MNRKSKLKESLILEQLKRFQKGLNRERIEKLVKEAMGFIEKRVRNRGLRSVIDDVMDLVGLVTDGLRGRFPTPWSEIMKIAGALLYLLSPVDLTPDTIPVAGFMDDVVVIGYVVRNIADTISAYRAWRGSGR